MVTENEAVKRFEIDNDLFKALNLKYIKVEKP